MCNRILKLFEKCWVYRYTMCIYNCPKGVDSKRRRQRENYLKFIVEQKTDYQIQWCPLYNTRAAAAIYTEQGQKEVKDLVSYYIDNARIIREGLTKAGFQISGGINAPYIWLKTIDGLSSWEFFDLMLSKVNVVGTPGVGFGPSGEGYFRLTSFGSKEKTIEAVQRIIQEFC